MPDQFVFLDRDGVINQDRASSVCHRSEFKLIDGVPDAVRCLNEKGYGVIVITNQACVGRGELDPDELKVIHSQMIASIRAGGGNIVDIYVCPHVDAADCMCRKPRPGLLEQAGEEHDIGLTSTWFVGDDERDMEAALAAGCRPAVVRTGKGSRWTPPEEVPVFQDLPDFARSIPHASEISSQ
jgi:D-glycero-D-manno-heptose 1,7-bisphosphate phosphatase